MDTLEYIDNYFSAEPSPAMKEEFERKISGDPSFAEEVAFYLSAKQVAGERAEKNDRFKQVYEQYKGTHKINTGKQALTRKLWPYIAAAAVLAVIIIGWAVFFKPASPAQLADRYIMENFKTLGVKMSGSEDSLQTGLRLYNEGKLNEALIQFESIIKEDTSSFDAKKYAGIVSLRIQDYDKAILRFSQIANYTQLYANPGKFYHALALLKRDRPGDKQEAKKELEEVVQKKMEGESEARQLLNRL